MDTLATLSSQATTASHASVMGTLTCGRGAPATPRLASASSVLGTRLVGTVSAARRTSTGMPPGQGPVNSLYFIYSIIVANFSITVY